MNFTSNYSESQLAEIARAGYGTISYKVKGFWSGNSIEVRINRGWVEKGKWTVEVSWSTGGRDSKEVESSIEAAQYFAEALDHAVRTASEIQTSKIEFLESLHQQFEAERKAEEAIRRAEFEEKRVADPIVSPQSLDKMIKELIKGNTVSVCKRGVDKPGIFLENTGRIKPRFRINGRVIAKDEIENELLELDASDRFFIAEVE